MGSHSLLAFDKAIVFFDSQCLLCSRFVNVILKNDKKSCQNDKYTCQNNKQTCQDKSFEIYFSGLDSQLARDILPGEIILGANTVVFSERGNLYFKSKAVFKIIAYLKFPWSLLNIFRILPKAVNDMVYDWVATNRIRWFGRSRQCYIADEKYRYRFFE